MTLLRLAQSLVDGTGHNPFRAPYSDIQLIYDYFRREGVLYNTTDASDSSMVFGVLLRAWWAPGPRALQADRPLARRLINLPSEPTHRR